MTRTPAPDGPPPRAAVISESMFGNTAVLAREIASELEGNGYEVGVWDVEQAPAPERHDVDLLVLGAPTHALSLSRPGTRADAGRQGAEPARTRTGLREWLDSADPHQPEQRRRIAFFDTKAARARHLPGSAARAASRLGSRHHLGRCVAVESFYVTDLTGPLLEGELGRARQFARRLATAVPARGDQPDRGSGG